MQFGVNHLGTFYDFIRTSHKTLLFSSGHFYLTNLLLDVLKESAPSRVINISGSAHFKGKINLEDLNSEENYNPAVAYNQSKLANILFTRELARQLKGTGVYVYAADPGITKTNLTRHMGFYGSKISSIFVGPFLWLFERSPFHATQVILRCALSPELANDEASGNYYK